MCRWAPRLRPGLPLRGPQNDILTHGQALPHNDVAAVMLCNMLQHHKIAAVRHGIRSSFRDWAAEKTDHPREVIEAALARVVQNKVDACARSDLSEPRHRLMDDWAVYLGQ